MIEICNLRKETPFKPYDFEVDRKSPLGNPFYMGHEINRNSVCEKYAEWFYHATHNQAFYILLSEMIKTYKQYGKLRLFCWCAPKRCHAETIKKYLENEKNSNFYFNEVKE